MSAFFRLLIISAPILLINGCISSQNPSNGNGTGTGAITCTGSGTPTETATAFNEYSCKMPSGQGNIQAQSSGALADDSAYLGEIAPEPSNTGPETGKDVEDIWTRMRQGFALNHHQDNARVQAELKWFLRHPQYLKRVVNRAEPYLYYVLSEIEDRKLPAELALLPVVESAYDPFAYSPGRASGLWQFIPATASMFKMKMDWWTDERRDLQISTKSALKYLARLRRSFKGDWLLALAGYNAGGRNVRSAIKTNKKGRKPTDYWSLKLFRETATYVPRLLALSMLVADPEKYGVNLKSIANQPYWTIVDTEGQLDLARAAELADISAREIYLLNPSYNQWSTHPDGPHKLLVPVNKAELFKSRLQSLSPEERLRWVLHSVKKGESLALIAKRNGTSVDTIKHINKLKSNLIRTGHSLMVPSSSFRGKRYSFNQVTNDKTSAQYLIQEGDTFSNLGDKFGVDQHTLAGWNGMESSDALQAGSKLIVLADPNTAALPEKPEIIRKVNYKVRNGESLSLIANKFNLSVGKIKKWNTQVRRESHIKPGQRLTLFVDVTQTE